MPDRCELPGALTVARLSDPAPALTALRKLGDFTAADFRPLMPHFGDRALIARVGTPLIARVADGSLRADQPNGWFRAGIQRPDPTVHERSRGLEPLSGKRQERTMGSAQKPDDPGRVHFY